jgi:hypothetical protein
MAREYGVTHPLYVALKVSSMLDAAGIKYKICDAPSQYKDNRRCSRITFSSKKGDDYYVKHIMHLTWKWEQEQ